jgi:hypothetical protein
MFFSSSSWFDFLLAKALRRKGKQKAYIELISPGESLCHGALVAFIFYVIYSG